MCTKSAPRRHCGSFGPLETKPRSHDPDTRPRPRHRRTTSDASRWVLRLQTLTMNLVLSTFPPYFIFMSLSAQQNAYLSLTVFPCDVTFAQNFRWMKTEMELLRDGFILSPAADRQTGVYSIQRHTQGVHVAHVRERNTRGGPVGSGQCLLSSADRTGCIGKGRKKPTRLRFTLHRNETTSVRSITFSSSVFYSLHCHTVVCRFFCCFAVLIKLCTVFSNPACALNVLLSSPDRGRFLQGMPPRVKPAFHRFQCVCDTVA